MPVELISIVGGSSFAARDYLAVNNSQIFATRNYEGRMKMTDPLVGATSSAGRDTPKCCTAF